jgi:hypothetical protein
LYKQRGRKDKTYRVLTPHVEFFSEILPNDTTPAVSSNINVSSSNEGNEEKNMDRKNDWFVYTKDGNINGEEFARMIDNLGFNTTPTIPNGVFSIFSLTNIYNLGVSFPIPFLPSRRNN